MVQHFYFAYHTHPREERQLFVVNITAIKLCLFYKNTI